MMSLSEGTSPCAPSRSSGVSILKGQRCLRVDAPCTISQFSSALSPNCETGCFTISPTGCTRFSPRSCGTALSGIKPQPLRVLPHRDRLLCADHGSHVGRRGHRHLIRSHACCRQVKCRSLGISISESVPRYRQILRTCRCRRLVPQACSASCLLDCLVCLSPRYLMVISVLALSRFTRSYNPANCPVVPSPTAGSLNRYLEGGATPVPNHLRDRVYASSAGRWLAHRTYGCSSLRLARAIPGTCQGVE